MTRCKLEFQQRQGKAGKQQISTLRLVRGRVKSAIQLRAEHFKRTFIPHYVVCPGHFFFDRQLRFDALVNLVGIPAT